MEEKSKEVAELLKLIANSNRLMILCVLEEGPQTVGELHKRIGAISMSALSQHLSVLKHSGLLDNRKEGLHVFYQIADPRILEVIRVLKETYCTP